MGEEQTLDEFVEQLQGRLTAFKGYYERGMESDKNYPPTMPEVDWFEQFCCYVEAVGEDDEDDDEANDEDDTTCNACDGTGSCDECEGKGCDVCNEGQCIVCEGSGVDDVYTK